MYNIAFIGGGINSAIGRTHKISCQMDGRFRLVAGAFSRHKDINTRTGQEFGVDTSRVYDDYREMLIKEKENVDIIAVLTPTNTHERIVMDVIEAGYPVICEKSLATSAESGKKICEAANDKESFLCVTYNYTGYPVIRMLRQMIKKGELGKINKIVAHMPQEGFIRYTADGKIPSPQEWRLSDYEIPTISLDLGTHLHNMIYFLTGEKPLEIVSQESTYGFFEDVVDDVSCMIKYTSDISAHMWFSKAALGHRNGLRIKVYGSEKAAEWYQLEPELLRVFDKHGCTSIIDRSNNSEIGLDERYNRFKIGHPAGFIEAFANYYSDIYDMFTEYKKTGRYISEYICSADASVEGLKMFETAHSSSLDNEWKKIL
ncbi:MAG: Gfo/Idh/MocA family oxidoreductase [Ruminococcus sp.]|nr:Gfo/Idh/MocA family oxidoreductase [Ruminococcus sp.]